MSALLYLPALLMNLNFHFGLLHTMGSLLFLLIAQLVIGYEFIAYDSQAYLGKAFEFSRVFFFKWSVNWQFLGEEVATGKDLAFKLLIAHLGLLVVFLVLKWTSLRAGLGAWLRELRLNEVGRA
jgi:alpha-1,3-mannosyltransferase